MEPVTDSNNHNFSTVEEYVKAQGGSRAIKRVLIANASIAAIKMIRSCRQWAYSTFGDERAVEFVAMATPEDLLANAEYIRYADQVCHVPGGSNVNNYANVNLIVEIAQSYKCDAVWAGWGHASENPRLPNTLDQIGIVFIGPPGKPMFALGDKIGSTIIAQSAKVPTIAWNGQGLEVNYSELGEVPESVYEKANVTTVEDAQRIIEELGVPVMIKASEGGGGKGIRLVDDMSKVEASFRQVQSEIPGSPIFIMRLSKASRHLEVQLLADMHGQAIALSGRDCSVQRRHQKILEEGPPIAADDAVWVEMEKAAVRLAKEVGYVNAGTVEYLYDANDNFFFLELNPRLQVEHPVTEMITGVNLPASQLQVAMGIPLHRIPDVRKFYGLEDPYGSSQIDFDGQYADPPTCKCRTHGHTIAARITAENPFNGFQPTSGEITEINFRSSRNVWGYFSVDSSGRVHEFADSQIGHIFAWGESREEARHNLAMALNDLSIRGEIRTTIEYLKDLIEVEEYVDNKFDTAWLDGRIKKNVEVSKIDPLTVILVGAVCTAQKEIAATMEEYRSMIERGQLPPPKLLEQFYEFELIYNNIKYKLNVSRTGEITYRVMCNDSHVDVELRTLADGGNLVLMGGKSHVAYAKKDVGAQRYMIDGQTCLFSDEYNPSEMRAMMGGKLLRFLVPDGASLEKGEAFAEIEVMKMNMQLCAQEAGKVSLLKPEGAVLGPGDLICTMELKDPSKVKKADLFTGKLPSLGEPWPPSLVEMPHLTLERALSTLENVVNGYFVSSETIEGALAAVDNTMHSPLLPVVELEGHLSCNKNALPSSLIGQVETLCSDFRSKLTAAAGASGAQKSFLEQATAMSKKIQQCCGSALNTSSNPAEKGAIEALETLASRYASGLDFLHVRLLEKLTESYVEVETKFAELEMSDAAERDDVLQELRSQYLGDPDAVVKLSLAYLSRRPRDTLMIRILNSLEILIRASESKKLIDEATSTMQKLASLQGQKTTEVALESRQSLIEIEHTYKEQLKNVVDKLTSWTNNGDEAASGHLIGSTEPVLNYLLDIIVHENMFPKEIRCSAMKLYVQRVYASYNVVKVGSEEADGENNRSVLRSEFTFFSDATDSVQVGSNVLTSVSSFEDLTSVLAPESALSLVEIGSSASHNSYTDGDNNQSECSSVGLELDAFPSTERPSAGRRFRSTRRGGLARQASDFKARAESVEAAPSHSVPPFVHRCGMVVYFSGMEEMETLFDSQVEKLGESQTEALSESKSTIPLSVLHVILSVEMNDEETFALELHTFASRHKAVLDQNGIRRLTFAIAPTSGKGDKEPEPGSEAQQQQVIVAGHGGAFFTFRSSTGYEEDRLVRNIETPLAFQLDLQRLANFNIRLVPIGKSNRKRSQTVHVYEATPKARIKGADMRRYFVRALVRQAERVSENVNVGTYDAYPGPERVFVQAITALESIQEESRPDKVQSTARKNHIFMNVLSDSADVNAEYVEGIIRTLNKRYAKRLAAQNVAEIEIRVHAVLAEGAPSIPIRVIASNPTGFALNIESYVEASDPNDPKDSIFYSISEGDGGLGGALAAMGLGTADSDLTSGSSSLGVGSLHGKPLATPYKVSDAFDERRARATAAGTTFCYDFPELFRKSLEYQWGVYLKEKSSQRPASSKIPTRASMVEAEELVLDDEMEAEGMPLSHGLCITERRPGRNAIAMVAWLLTLRTPEYPSGRKVVLISNDITNRAGSFGTREDELFNRASKYARAKGIPRLYIAANSGARIGMADEVKRAFQVKWTNPEEPAKGYDYLYVDEETYQQLGPDGRKSIICTQVPGTAHFKIDAIIGESPDLGVENLRGSGAIAGETSRAYDDCFTLSYVSGRTVGIGAYLVRLGHRVIQKGSNAPILLTGYQALNALMQKRIYTSNTQLGGTGIMFGNGVSHQCVRHDLEGVTKMLDWLSYVPESRKSVMPLTALSLGERVERPVAVNPSLFQSAEYDPRLLLSGMEGPDGWLPGFFDRGSFVEMMGGWGKSIVTGRARLGKLPMGVIISEYRTVQARAPADPAALDTQERVWAQGGRAWYPDSAYKTAQAISDINREGLPLMLFANWRGFSAGTRDSFDQVLKFGSFIVDELVDFKQPCFVYLPPFGELRGGAWVVVDPSINSRCMEMYAAPEARAGVLEAPGAASIKFRKKDQVSAAHRLDPKLIALDAKLRDCAQGSDEEKSLKAAITKREEVIAPVFLQLAVAFADHHDRPQRMMAKKCIRKIVPWEESRVYFYHRLRRRLAEMQVLERISDSVVSLGGQEQADNLLNEILSKADVLEDDDKAVYSWLMSEEGKQLVEAEIDQAEADAIAEQVVAMGEKSSKAVLLGLMRLVKKLQETGRDEERQALVQTLRRGVLMMH